MRDATALPTWQRLQPDLAHAFANLSLTEVVGADATARFRIKFHGSRVGELYGRTSCAGKFLDEILPAGYSAPALATYRQVVATRLPVYTIADMRDPAGRIVHYERLLLPLGSDGDQVEEILASLEIVSPEGAFEHHGLMKTPGKAPAFAFLTTIQY